MYKLASALSCTAQEDCSGGPSFRDQLAVNADGCATQEPWPFARCIHMPKARSSPVMHIDLHWSVGLSMQGQSTGSFHTVDNVSHTSRMASAARGPLEATIILSRNWAKAIRRPVAVRHIGYPPEDVLRTPHCLDRALCKWNAHIQYRSADCGLTSHSIRWGVLSDYPPPKKRGKKGVRSCTSSKNLSSRRSIVFVFASPDPRIECVGGPFETARHGPDAPEHRDPRWKYTPPPHYAVSYRGGEKRGASRSPSARLLSSNGV